LAADDYEQFLSDRGHTGREFSHGGCTNDYKAAPWNLPEELHPTNWAAREMLGDHGLWGKTFLHERSVRMPLIVAPPASRKDAPCGVADARLAELRDIMPTLLDLCGLPVPETVEGHSLFGGTRRPYLYAEHGAGELATRLIRSRLENAMYSPTGTWAKQPSTLPPSKARCPSG